MPIFDDEQSRLKLSLNDIDGEAIIVPNFTLYGRNKKGRSLDYTYSLGFEQSQELFEKLKKQLTDINSKVYFGEFGAYMQIESVVDGPVNLVLEY